MGAKRIVFVLAMVFVVSPLSMVEAQPSVLSRIMTVDDPGLAECLRVAVDRLVVPMDLAEMYPSGAEYQKLKGDFEAKRLEVSRVVTESYAKIKLLDSQIEQINQRLHSSSLPEGLSYELVTARAELEMKRTMELAKLRANMGVVPRYALGPWPADQLIGWVVLDVVDANHVCMFRYKKPFYDYTLGGMPMSSEFLGLKSGEQVEAILSEWIARKDGLPLRIQILRTKEGNQHGVRLYDALVQLARKAGVEMDVDIRLGSEVRGKSIDGLAVVGGEVGKCYNRPGSAQLVDKIAPNGLDRWIRDRLEFRPGRFPVEWVIEYHAGSQELAFQVAKRAQEIVREKGEESLVEVTLEPTSRQWAIDTPNK